MKKNKIRISIGINITITILTLLSTIVMYTGFKFMHGVEPVLETAKLGMLKFFTIDSNVFMAIVALIFAINEINVLKGKTKEISKRNYVLKLMSTTAVAITFATVFLYLGPISKGGVVILLQNSNLFFHLIIPVLSIITFIFFEKTDRFTIKDTLYGVMPTFLYAIYYLINILIHMENGRVSPVYDWYWFVQKGVWTALIVAPFMFLTSYLISLILYKINKNT